MNRIIIKRTFFLVVMLIMAMLTQVIIPVQARAFEGNHERHRYEDHRGYDHRREGYYNGGYYGGRGYYPPAVIVAPPVPYGFNIVIPFGR